jgi:hypothetical protein
MFLMATQYHWSARSSTVTSSGTNLFMDVQTATRVQAAMRITTEEGSAPEEAPNRTIRGGSHACGA